MNNKLGWVEAADVEMTLAHIGVADESDDYDTASKKLRELIQWHVDVATDHRVNGGLVQVPLQATDEMVVAGYKALMEWDARTGDDYGMHQIWEAMLSAASISPQPTMPQPETNCPRIDGSKLSAHDQVTRDEFDQEAM